VKGLADRLAARTRRIAGYYGGLGLLAWDVGRNAWLPRRYVPLVATEFDGMGVRSLVVANTAAVFTGMVFALQASLYLSRFGADLYVGPLVALSLVRELGPVLTAILVGGKVASGITAELGSMMVTEQIDALRAIGVNYVKRLIVPRIWAALLVFPLLTVLADFVGLLGGMLVAVYERQIDLYLYWNTIFYWVVIRDLLSGLGKSFFFGVLVTLIGAYNGLAMSGGTEGIGRATTATVVQVSVGVIIADFFLTKLFMLFG
jgi:phospholipid/cholesterol/gamma-HCH transport system permease protein